MLAALRNYAGRQKHNLRSITAEAAVAGPIRKGRVPHNLPGELIVSLTSYPDRFPTLHKTVRSLLSQDMPADRTILWVAHEDAPLVPRAVIDTGIEVRTCDNTRSYKKIIPALKEFPTAFIATADDDVYYPRDWLATLVSGSEPGVITCRRAHKPMPGPYSAWQWEIITNGEVRDDLFPTGCGGVLYPPNSLAPETCNVEAFTSLAPTADDVWLYCMAKRAGSLHRQVGGRFPLITWNGTQENSLQHHNVNGANDAQLREVLAWVSSSACAFR
jgi:hypothetical protein